MSLILNANSGTGGSYSPLEAGSYPARLTAIIMLGTQTNPQFGTSAPKLIFEYEIIGETLELGDKQIPRTLTAEYTVSLNKKANLYSVVQTLLGRSIVEGENVDIYSLLGSPCMLNVVLTEKGDKKYSNIDAVTQPMKGYVVPPSTLEEFIFDFEDNYENYAKVEGRLPKYHFDKIALSPEYKMKVNDTKEIPF